MLVESHAKPGIPLWFREGLVLYLAQSKTAGSESATFGDDNALNKTLHNPASEQEMRQAYAEAQARVTKMAREHGIEVLVGWLQNGMPELQ